MNRFWRRTWWLVPLVAAVAVGGCARSRQPKAAAAPKPPEVFVDLPTTAEVNDYEDFTGRTVATKTIDIRARVTGYLDKIDFEGSEGAHVEEGFVLFEIDARPYEAEAARADASLVQAQSHYARVERDYDRASKLVENKTITREQFDLVSGDRAEAKAAIEIAKANLDLAKLNLAFTKVRAPISGRVGRTMVDPGNLVRADETILTTIVNIDPVYAYFEADERTILRLRRFAEEGQVHATDQRAVPVKMGLADEDGFPHEGSINFVDNRLDPATGTLQLRGVFPNPDRMLSPGLFVRVRLPIGKPYQALTVPEQALGTDQGQKFVYVIGDDNKAQYRRVEVGRLQQGRRVIAGGLAEGERVVVSGLQRVRPGAEVQPRMVESTARRADEPSPATAEAKAATKKETVSQN